MKLLLKLFLVVFLLSACGPLVPVTSEPFATPNVDAYQDFAYDMVWSQDDSMVALTTETGLYIYSTKTYDQLFSFAQNGSTVVFGNKYVALINWQGLFVYDLNDFKLLFSERTEAGRKFQSLAISPDDTTLIAGEQDRLRAWSLPEGKVIATITDENQVFWNDVAFKDNSHFYVADSYYGHVQEWDIKTQKMIRQFEFDKPIVYLRLSQDAKLALVDYGLTGFQIWDTGTGKLKQNYGDIVSASGWQRLSRDNHYAVVWGYAFDGHYSGMSIWDLDIHLNIQEFKTPFVNGDGWRCGALNSDGSILAASNNEGYIYFYKVKTGEEIGRIFLAKKFSL